MSNDDGSPGAPGSWNEAHHRLDQPVTGISIHPRSTVESELVVLEASAQVAEALTSLGRAERDAIVAAFYGRANYLAVAADSGVPAEVVRSRVRRGLIRMERALRRSGSAMMV
jgi:DNA-directed RNA polymerase specialized sigma24 family protein